MKKIIIIYILIFSLLFPVAKGINYVSNDEWVYYGLVNSFARGNFTLDSYIGATFYLMGFMAVLFSKGFGVQNIPVLTLMVSISSLFVFNLILINIFRRKILDSLIFTAILFFNPIFVYSMWGFMTENYFLLFFLISLYFYLASYKHFLSGGSKEGFMYLNFGNLFSILGYFVRQTSLLTILATAVFLLIYSLSLQRKHKFVLLKSSAYQFIIFGLIMLYHFFLFPKTPDMLETKLNFSNIFYFRYMFSLFFIAGIYVCFSCLALVLIYIKKSSIKSGKYLLIAFPMVLLSFLFYFKPTIQWRSNFYYMQNVLQRRGFFVENLHGNKFSFHYFSNIYSVLDITSKILLIFLVLILIRKRKFDFFLVYTVVYITVLSLSPLIFDRYLLPVFVVCILFFAREMEKESILKYRFIVLPFVLALFYYSYNFSVDYILTNRYVWNKALELHNINKIPKGNIVTTIAWDYINGETKTKPVFKFTYDGPQTRQYKNNSQYTLLETHKIIYPLSFWINPYVYLYKINY